MVFQYTHILCRVSERRSQDRVPKLTGISGCCKHSGRIVGNPEIDNLAWSISAKNNPAVRKGKLALLS
jgi:hypothetical protein